MYPSIKNPLVTDIQITRDTAYEDGKYMCTMVITTDDLILEVSLEPITNSNEALALYNLIGTAPISIDTTMDLYSVTKTITFKVGAYGGKGNALLMTLDKIIKWRDITIKPRFKVVQLSFVKTADGGNLAIKVEDLSSGHGKWYNAAIPTDPKGAIEFAEKIFSEVKNDPSCTVTGFTMTIGKIPLSVSCEMEEL